jgi:hypothetical protein
VACLRMGRQGGGSDPANAPSVSPRQQMDVQRAVVSRDNLDENGGGNQGLKRRPVAKS